MATEPQSCYIVVCRPLDGGSDTTVARTKTYDEAEDEMERLETAPDYTGAPLWIEEV